MLGYLVHNVFSNLYLLSIKSRFFCFLIVFLSLYESQSLQSGWCPRIVLGQWSEAGESRGRVLSLWALLCSHARFHLWLLLCWQLPAWHKESPPSAGANVTLPRHHLHPPSTRMLVLHSLCLSLFVICALGLSLYQQTLLWVLAAADNLPRGRQLPSRPRDRGGACQVLTAVIYLIFYLKCREKTCRELCHSHSHCRVSHLSCYQLLGCSHSQTKRKVLSGENNSTHTKRSRLFDVLRKSVRWIVTFLDTTLTRR